MTDVANDGLRVRWQAIVSLLLMAFPLADAPDIVNAVEDGLRISSGRYAGVILFEAVLLGIWLAAFVASQRRMRWLPLLVPVVLYGLVGALFLLSTRLG